MVGGEEVGSLIIRDPTVPPSPMLGWRGAPGRKVVRVLGLGSRPAQAELECSRKLLCCGDSLEI